MPQKRLKCEGDTIDFETDSAFGDGDDVNYDEAARKGKEAALKKIEAIYTDRLKTIRCPGDCEPWLRLRTEVQGPPYGKLRDPRTGMILLRVVVKWHIDVRCVKSTSEWPPSGKAESQPKKGKLY